MFHVEQSAAMTTDKRDKGPHPREDNAPRTNAGILIYLLEQLYDLIGFLWIH